MVGRNSPNSGVPLGSEPPTNKKALWILSMVLGQVTQGGCDFFLRNRDCNMWADCWGATHGVTDAQLIPLSVLSIPGSWKNGEGGGGGTHVRCDFAGTHARSIRR